jgi:cytoskeleton protein RodZ
VSATAIHLDQDLVAVRRNVWLSGVVAGLAALIGAGYLARGSSLLDTAVGLGLLVVALIHASALVPAGTPVLVADEQGIRLRVGLGWRGLPWSSVRQVVVEQADNPLREGRLVVVPRDPGAVVEHLDALARLHLRWNELWYGAALSVPLGMTTLTDSRDLGGDLDRMADGRTDVVHLRGRQLAQLDLPAEPDVETDALPRHVAQPEAEPTAAAHSEPPAHAAAEPDQADLEALPEPVAPVRALNLPARVEVRLDAAAVGGREEAEPSALLGQVPAQRRPVEVAADLPALEVPDLVHSEAWEEVAVEIESDDLAVHTPAEPVIGPQIVHARQMLDLDIDELSRRTRIRPHVLEALEVDDFGPCGGDFYARGHLTAVARVLGIAIDPLIKDYDERYAGGPINARRVFEAELATGLSSGMRATRGGPHWSLLIGAVLCLTMVWGMARLVAGDPEQVAAPQISQGQSAGLAANRQPITSPLMKTTQMTVTAAHAGAHVVIKDRTDRVLWSGDLPMTHHRKIVGLAPFTVESDNAGAIEVTVAGRPRGTLGTAGEAASKRFD